MGNIVNLKIFTQKKKWDDVSNNLQKGKTGSSVEQLKKKNYSKNNKEIINKQVTTVDLPNHREK